MKYYPTSIGNRHKFAKMQNPTRLLPNSRNSFHFDHFFGE
jgi:hypothetical protein